MFLTSNVCHLNGVPKQNKTKNVIRFVCDVILFSRLCSRVIVPVTQHAALLIRDLPVIAADGDLAEPPCSK